MKVISFDPQKSLYKLSYQIGVSHQKLKNEFPNWSEDDFRLAMYSRCSNIVESVLFARIFENEQLTQKNWYEKVPYIVPPDEQTIRVIINSFDSHLRVLLVTAYFSSIETFFRILFKTIFTQSKTTKIHIIIEKILKEFGLQKDYQYKFDLYRIIRNSLHNNGIVTDPYAYPILYRGVWYNHKKGEPIKVNWLMLCQLTAELDDCLNKIIHSEKAKNLDPIKDPSS